MLARSCVGGVLVGRESGAQDGLFSPALRVLTQVDCLLILSSWCPWRERAFYAHASLRSRLLAFCASHRYFSLCLPPAPRPPSPVPPWGSPRAGQDSTIHFVRFDQGGAVSEQRVRYALLPVTSLAFLSEKAVVGGGHDMNPLVFTADPSGQW